MPNEVLGQAHTVNYPPSFKPWRLFRTGLIFTAAALSRARVAADRAERSSAVNGIRPGPPAAQ